MTDNAGRLPQVPQPLNGVLDLLRAALNLRGVHPCPSSLANEGPYMVVSRRWKILNTLFGFLDGHKVARRRIGCALPAAQERFNPAVKAVSWLANSSTVWRVSWVRLERSNLYEILAGFRDSLSEPNERTR